MIYTCSKAQFVGRFSDGFEYILAMQRFRVVYHGISQVSLVFSRYTYKPLGECVYLENTSDKWDIPWYTMRRWCITSYTMP